MPEANEELIQFGRNLARLRKDKKITQEELAYLADIDRSYISGIESGHRNVALLNILKLARALELEAKVLLDYA
ncbi:MULTISPECIES: helix-turn-helix domain-containing protein [unclassified Oleiphilus]|uniref:helix-turn-helix domain-containing protein n=1 Tax=unclassified Oleiphilus TaxID=2631174 RepID=UPI0007C2E2E8|nr:MULTISPECIES: helix-turn-helix transcriptional regulator [unclassified Oleiphilus]KZZ37314.1 transcriptional regulator [Oleiphilus sp. HI0117]KZZ54208.1 transcriptional regulator [Oleiphilus sp. HI0123]KZZ60613.1 transcriptional regulator [Oleiphilus sp. HI0123]